MLMAQEGNEASFDLNDKAMIVTSTGEGIGKSIAETAAWHLDVTDMENIDQFVGQT